MAKAAGVGCPRCRQRDAEAAQLREQVSELRALVDKLQAELAKAQKNSSNSSKPPSSDIVNPPAKGTKPGRSKKRRRGGQPGHPRHVRTLFDESELDQIWDWRYPCCPDCAGALKDADQEPLRQQQIEVEKKPFRIEEHRRIAQWCPSCQRLHVPGLPAKLADAGLFGPRLTALVGWLKGVCHMSVSSIRKYFRDVVGVAISRGMIAKLVNKVSAALRAPHEELLEQLATEDRLNVDETGHKDNGRKLWTWCFRAYLYTVFKISPSRGSDVLVEVLGREFEGILGCDYFSAYRKYMRLNDQVTLQFCLAHLIRDYKFLAEQAIRYVAIHRRLTQGTRGETGQRWFERIATVIQTCGQQGRSTLEFILCAVERFFAGEPAPSLLPSRVAAALDTS